MKIQQIPAADFDLAKTLDSGQVFHWETHDNGFLGTIGRAPIYVEQRGSILEAFHGPRKLDRFKRSSFKQVIKHYFALDHPLESICRSLPRDPTMTAAKQFCRGLRIIRQPKWECLAMFICSSMKQVAHIRQISLALRKRFGERVEIALPYSVKDGDGGSAAPSGDANECGFAAKFNIEQGTARSTSSCVVYTFPAVERMADSSDKELRECALGYRAKNLLATARLIAGGDVDLENLAKLSDADLRKALCALPGVGAKVANCVMLFAYERLRAFPIDVWIERVLRENYFPGARKLNARRLQTFTEGYFGDHGGYAQQYLFHYARTNRRESGRLRHERNLSRIGC